MFGMPLFTWTPPLSAAVFTYWLNRSGCGTVPTSANVLVKLGGFARLRNAPFGVASATVQLPSKRAPKTSA